MTNGNNSQLASIVRRIEALEAAKADTTRAINQRLCGGQSGWLRRSRLACGHPAKVLGRKGIGRP